MHAAAFIKSKLQQWAIRNNINLIGSQITKGEKNYTKDLHNNLFIYPSEITLKDFRNADGDELGHGAKPGKMQALHSSSALAVNFFEYWKKQNDKELVVKTLRIPSKNISDIRFERKFPIFDTNKNPPNIDVVFEYNDQSICAIECKFTEAYSKQKQDHGLKIKYFQKINLWDNLPNLKDFAKSISPEDINHKYFHPAQLIKHTLGLLNHFNCDKKKFRLLYIWYDAFGEEGYTHRKELNLFSNIIVKDNIKFQSITWQELIIFLATKQRKFHKKYIDYITDRYL